MPGILPRAQRKSPTGLEWGSLPRHNEPNHAESRHDIQGLIYGLVLFGQKGAEALDKCYTVAQETIPLTRHCGW